MLKGVYFLKDTSKFCIEGLPQDTVLVYSEMYNLPDIKNITYMNFKEFRNKYFEIKPNMFILVGLNRLINPANRCDLVFDYLQTITSNIPKISIDTEPFVGEPWRLWYHYDITKCGRFNFPHGYAIETEWKHWFYRDQNDCILSKNNLDLFIADTYSDIELLKTTFNFYDVEDSELQWYKEVKEHVFNTKNSPKLIINELLKLSNKRFNIDLSYDSFRENKHFEVPDLKIYEFVVEENLRRLGTYNKVVECSESI